jgi:hypothetical protein
MERMSEREDLARERQHNAQTRTALLIVQPKQTLFNKNCSTHPPRSQRASFARSA